MKYIEVDYERGVIRIFRPLEINPTNYLPYKIYKLNIKNVARIMSTNLKRIELQDRNIEIYW